MFTEQVGQLDKLVGKVPAEMIDILRSVLGNCSQPLVHRGPVTFTGPVDFTDGAGLTSWAKATATWVNLGGASNYVDCTKANRDGSLLTGTVRVYLPETQSMQPNVRSGDILGYMLDSAGDAVCTSDYLDDRIGSIKAWNDPDNIPPGWSVIASGRTLFGYSAGDPDFGSIGGTGGSRTHTHGAHDASGISAHSGENTGDPGSVSVSFSGSTSPATSSGSAATAEGTISGSGNLAIGSASPALNVPTTYALSEYVTVSDPGHTHDLTYAVGDVQAGSPVPYYDGPTESSTTDMTFQGQNTGDGASGSQFRAALYRPTVFSGVTVESHTHDINLSTLSSNLSISAHGHTVTMDEHSHSISASGSISGHTHTIPSLSHSGSLSHSTEDHLPPFYVACWIQRTS